MVVLVYVHVWACTTCCWPEPPAEPCACVWLPQLWDQVRRARNREGKDDDVPSPFLANVVSLFLNKALDSSADTQQLRGA